MVITYKQDKVFLEEWMRLFSEEFNRVGRSLLNPVLCGEEMCWRDKGSLGDANLLGDNTLWGFDVDISNNVLSLSSEVWGRLKDN